MEKLPSFDFSKEKCYWPSALKSLKSVALYNMKSTFIFFIRILTKISKSGLHHRYSEFGWGVINFHGSESVTFRFRYCFGLLIRIRKYLTDPSFGQTKPQKSYEWSIFCTLGKFMYVVKEIFYEIMYSTPYQNSIISM